MKFVTYVEEKETRFPEFNIYDHKQNSGHFVLVMNIENDDEIKSMINNKKSFKINMKENFIILENESLAYSFNAGDLLKKIKNEMINLKLGIVFVMKDNKGEILDDFRPPFGCKK